MTLPHGGKRLVDDRTLAASPVVANNTMNRDRVLTGSNGYATDLRFDPLEWLLAKEGPSAWLDLCCGSGRALGEAANQLRDRGRLHDVHLTGIDLVDFFAGDVAAEVELVCAPIDAWIPESTFDLITCVHGLHYVGDKLAAIEQASRWLTPNGKFVANFDVDGVRDERGKPLGQPLRAAIRREGLALDRRWRRVSLDGQAPVHFGFEYLGADDAAGPNYTGQPAVHSYYRPIPTS
jgi:SAM-dependent methyltransferase